MTLGFWLLAAAGLVTVESFLRANVLGKCAALAQTAARSAKVLRRRASDHWKERAITALWLQMMRRTLALAVVLLGVFLPVLLLYAADRTWALGAFKFMGFGPLHFVLIALLVGYAVMRRRLRTRQRARG